MAEVTFRVMECPYRINRVSSKVMESFKEIKKKSKKLKGENFWLDRLIYDLELILKSSNSAECLEEKREELRTSVYLLPDLDILSTDTLEVRKEKLILGAELIELIES